MYLNLYVPSLHDTQLYVPESVSVPSSHGTQLSGSVCTKPGDTFSNVWICNYLNLYVPSLATLKYLNPYVSESVCSKLAWHSTVWICMYQAWGHSKCLNMYASVFVCTKPGDTQMSVCTKLAWHSTVWMCVCQASTYRHQLQWPSSVLSLPVCLATRCLLSVYFYF